jgi:hypothetical protein
MISNKLISKFQADFDSYVLPLKSEFVAYNATVGKIILHIERVVENIQILAEALELSENEKQIAEIVALFHDIGRIWLLFPENSAVNITDHADASIEYLNSNQLFSELDNPTQNIIIQTIKGHNKPEIPKKEDEAILFYSKLLRDADKLDTWRSTVEYIMAKSGKPNMAVELNLSEKPFVTPMLCNTIIAGGIPNKSDIVTFNDFTIFQMSWIFDLHFKKTYQILNQKQYMRHLYDSLPKNDSVIEIYRMIRIHIENQI